MPRWVKQGCLFVATGQHDWMTSHVQLPVLDIVDARSFRIYFATRDRDNRSRVGFLDVSADDPRQILRLSERPALDLGELGCFDDCGVLPSWITNYNGKKYLFYIGVNTGVNVTGRTAIGVAESTDGGETFQRVFPGPIVERHSIEAHLCTAPCVLPGLRWRMWYASGTAWELVQGRPEPSYLIRQTESTDGLSWARPGHIAIEFDSPSEAGLARPSVLFDGQRYRMWFCARGRNGYRAAGPAAYHLAYAESIDGRSWDRLPVQPGLDAGPGGWDSEMIAYPYVFLHRGRLEVLYNGNGFGKSGFGHAVLENGAGK